MAEARAEFFFKKPSIKAIVTTIGGKKIDFKQEAYASYGLSEKEIERLSKALGLDQRQVVLNSDTTTSDLCFNSAKKIMEHFQADPKSISALIFVSQSPDYSAPSTAISLQNRLGLPTTSMAFDMPLGCSGFIYGLNVAYSLIESGLQSVLLCVGDVASRFVNKSDYTIAPLMGDAGSAILIEAGHSNSYFQLYSDGSGKRALMIPNSGLRRDKCDVGLDPFMKMDGVAVFSFTLQKVSPMIQDIMKFSNYTSSEIDFFVLHQPNKYILTNIQKQLNIPDEKFPKATQSVYGNQNSASIPGTIGGFLSQSYQEKKLTSLFCGFGIGLSWGACVLETENIYAPKPFLEEDI